MKVQYYVTYQVFNKRVYFQALFSRVMPEDVVEHESGGSEQLIRDVLLLCDHMDPQIRGTTSAVVGSFLMASLTCAG